MSEKPEMSAKEFRRYLRRNQTKAEAKLWYALRNRKLDGHKFRRQHSIGNYIVDFICLEKKLIIELEGSVHDDPRQGEYDLNRRLWLEKQGYSVLRIENRYILECLDEALEFIGRNFLG